MTTWFFSDTHFRHDKLLTFYSPGEGRARFSSIKEFEDHFTATCDEAFKESDTIVFVGDMCMGKGKAEYIVNWIKARKWEHFIFVLGNHDPRAETLLAEWEKNGDPWREFQVVTEYNFTDEMGMNYQVQHYPPPDADVERHKTEESAYHHKGHLAALPKGSNPGQVVVHGHTHLFEGFQILEDNTICLHVGVDAANGYEPISFEDMQEIIALIILNGPDAVRENLAKMAADKVSYDDDSNDEQ